jgi:parvulin-like peptidyl-prolyl isomerase
MMKHSFTAVLLLIAISWTTFGQALYGPTQTLNVPAVRIETRDRDTVAEVNNEKISRSSLAAECLQLHGKEELQELIGNTLIRRECDRLKVSVTAEEINAEILQTAQTYKMSSDEWLKLIAEQRGVPSEKIRQDVGWKLALAKLAGPRITISPAEIQAEYDKNFGAAVQVREIVLASKAEAEAVRAEVIQHPETFASLAKNRSINPVTQPYGGIFVLRRGSYNPQVEQILFAMKPKDVAPVVEYPVGHFNVYRCEGHLQPQDVNVDAVKEQLVAQIRSTKLFQATNDTLIDLQKRGQVLLIYGSDNPTLRQQYPGVAALVNGHVISLQDVADACIQKYGKEVLGEMIDRKIVEQACRQANIIISEQDIDKEIHEMAVKHLPLTRDGTPDVAEWLKRATAENGLSIPMYRKNVIVPVLGMKRLTRPSIQVLEEEIQRAFEAHYGKKIQCLAILLDANDRRAMEVWQEANRNKSEEHFSALAEKHSFDPESRLGKGMIPPISRYCGNPELETAAFALQPRELSHIIQVGDSAVILYCVKHIEPLPVKIDDVKVDLITAIFEKKQQIAVARLFEKLSEQAVWINHLTGTSQNPALDKATREALDTIR